MEGHLTKSKNERAGLVVMAKVMESEMEISEPYDGCEASELLGLKLSADVSDCLGNTFVVPSSIDTEGPPRAARACSSGPGVAGGATVVSVPPLSGSNPINVLPWSASECPGVLLSALSAYPSLKLWLSVLRSFFADL